MAYANTPFSRPSSVSRNPDIIHVPHGRKALLIEKYAAGTYPFIDGLHQETYCRVRHEQSLDVGLRILQQEYFDIVLVTVEQQTVSALQIFEAIRAQARELLVRCPYVILLSERPEQADLIKCTDLGAKLMFRQHADPVYLEAKLLFAMLDRRPFKSTIRIDFQNGHHTAYFAFSTAWAEIEAANRLLKTAVTMAGGKKSYTVEWVADALGICRQSAKQYICLLNQKTFDIQLNLGIAEPVADVFWMRKELGGTLCGIRANIVWT